MGLLDGLKMVMVDFVRIFTTPPFKAFIQEVDGIG
jgi:hypothetical protein